MRYFFRLKTPQQILAALATGKQQMDQKQRHSPHILDQWQVQEVAVLRQDPLL